MSGGNSIPAKGCGSCQLCCPSMRPVCRMPNCYSSCQTSCCSPCCEPCCPPSGFGCKDRGPCPTPCCGARCSQVTCCPKPTIVPIQIWGCTPHGCCKTEEKPTTLGGGDLCCQ